MNVFLFPGQGSQAVGMGADLFKSDPVFRLWIALASECAGEDLEPVCLRGPEKKLTQTRLLQPLLVAVSLGYLRQLTERSVHPDLVLGHSLGEITALAAAGMVSPEDAIRIAARRGELMEAAAARLDGAMLVVTLEDRAELVNWLESDTARGRVVLANDNAPTQLVLSGDRHALNACAGFIARERLGRCRLLPVSGPWHSPHMADAAVQFAVWLESIPLQPPRAQMLFNLTAGTATDPGEIRGLISNALVRPVLWRECMAKICDLRPQRVFEIGPGRVLSGLARANHLPASTAMISVNNSRGVALACSHGAEPQR